MLFENIIKFVFFVILVAFICDGGAGEGAGVVGGEGDLARGIWRGGIAFETEGDRDRVSS